MVAAYEDSVFLNVPFDKKYARLFDGLVFAVHDCGFVARSAFEVDDSGIHDISRAGSDRQTGLARFNMPLELGFFLGAKRYGTAQDRQKCCLVLDRERYRYRSFCSDIAGQDIRAHNDQPREAIRAVRDWLSTQRTASKCLVARRSSTVTNGFELSLQCKPRMFTSILLS